MYLRLIRKPTHTNAVRGTLVEVNSLWGDRVICDTLENRDYLIPEMFYPVSVTMSPKFGRLMPLIGQVPSRSGIRIHRGTRPSHSTGCILVATRDVETSLTNYLLQIQRSHEEIRLEVTHWEPAYPGYPRTDYHPNHTAAEPTAREVQYIEPSLAE